MKAKGTDLIATLVKDPKQVKIQYAPSPQELGAEPNTPTRAEDDKGSGSKVYFRLGSGEKASLEVKDLYELLSDAAILGHELIHSMHMAAGRRDQRWAYNYFTDSKGERVPEWDRAEEFRTIGTDDWSLDLPGAKLKPSKVTENDLHQELGDGVRPVAHSPP